MTTTYRVEVYWVRGTDGRAVEVLDQVARLGIAPVHQLQISDLTFLRGDLAESVSPVETAVEAPVEGSRSVRAPRSGRARSVRRRRTAALTGALLRCSSGNAPFPPRTHLVRGMRYSVVASPGRFGAWQSLFTKSSTYLRIAY